jgi:hypothetical protein
VKKLYFVPLCRVVLNKASVIRPMNKLKQLLTSLKFIVFVVVLTGVVLVRGFIHPGTPHITESTTPRLNNTATQSLDNLNPATQSPDNPDAKVWVNTDSGVYHCPNTRWYGKTKRGKFMTQREAQSQGYRPAHAAMCG